MNREEIDNLGLKRCDLVEILLTFNAVEFTAGKTRFCIPDHQKTINIQGRKHVGYLTEIAEDHITLNYEINNPKPSQSESGIKYYFGVIESINKR